MVYIYNKLRHHAYYPKKLGKKLLNISCIALVLYKIIFNSRRGMVIACNCIDFTALHEDVSKYLTVQDTHFSPIPTKHSRTLSSLVTYSPSYHSPQ